MLGRIKVSLGLEEVREMLHSHDDGEERAYECGYDKGFGDGLEEAKRILTKAFVEFKEVDNGTSQA